MTTLASRPMTAPARVFTPAPRPPGRADRRDAAVRTLAGVAAVSTAGRPGCGGERPRRCGHGPGSQCGHRPTPQRAVEG